jgi:hypothetical protein
MHTFVGRDRAGRLCHYWNRTFVHPNAVRRINAHLVWEPDRKWVAEWMGPGGCFEMAWHVRFLPPSAIEVNARLEALRFGRLRIPLPRPLQVDNFTVDTADPQRENLLRCTLRLTSPVLGPLFGYEGTFLLRRITRDEGYGLRQKEKGTRLADRQQTHGRWLKAAAIYSVAWGTANVIWPRRALRILGVSESGPLFAWQTVAMMVAAFAPAYWWASKNPRRHAHIVAVGLAAKVLGPLGFGWALKTRRLPLRFGLTIVSNDLVWWPAFASIVHDAAVSAGGWRAFLAGITSDE